MISVIIPLYNSEKKIGRCLKSLLSQTYDDLEIIVINDGSVDKSEDIVKQYVEKDSRVKYSFQDNKGVSYARNKGLQLASGQYVMFVDSDDFVAKDMLESMIRIMRLEKSDLVIAGIVEKKPEGTKKILPNYNKTISTLKIGVEYPEIFSTSIINSPCNKLYKRILLKGIEFPCGISLGEDLLFNLEVIERAEKVTFCKKAYYFYDCTDEGLTHKYREDYIRIQELLYVKSKEFINTLRIGQEAQKDISTTFIRFFFYGLSDMYLNSNKSNIECRKELNKWMKNTNIIMASRDAYFASVAYKVAVFLVKHNCVLGVHAMLLAKKVFNEARMNE